MNKVVKLLLALIAVSAIYLFLRLTTGLSENNFLIRLNQITIGLIFSLFFIYLLFNSLRFNPQKGPTIVNSSKLKKYLYVIVGFWWLAIITWLLSDSFKHTIPFNFLKVYQLANLLDETISHIVMFLSIITFSLTGLLLEIERPFLKAISQKELIIIIFLSIPVGIFWGLNLTEGRLSIFTSLPAMLIYIFLSIYLFLKHKLSFKTRPWSLASTIIYLTGTISFSTWGIVFNSFPEVFEFIK